MAAYSRRSSLDDSELVPGTGRSRIATWVGILLLVGILGALIWFGVSNTETHDASPAAVPAPSP